MNILLAGGGGREHALAWRLARDGHRVVCPNGNPGIAAVAETPRIELKDPAAWRDYARDARSDLLVVGPEDLLAQGIADAFEGSGVPVFGPSRAAAELEWSKAFAKDVMRVARVPTADFHVFHREADALDYLTTADLPIVVKADGLAAGKGVVIAKTREDARIAIRENLRDGRFGAASRKIVMEEYMTGDEVSIFALCDGENVALLPAAQDHKRLLDGDQGPNTGGMGAYSPVPQLSSDLLEQIHRQVIVPTIQEMARRAVPLKGVLFAGLMLTPSGPKVLEFNTRFGDPETQVLMPGIAGDLGELLLACATGRLAASTVKHTGKAAATVVLAAEGYPGSPKRGDPITGLDSAAEMVDAYVFHAGTARDLSGRIVTAGGRVLSCTAWRGDLAEARAAAYRLAGAVDFAGKQFRRDIGSRALRSDV